MSTESATPDWDAFCYAKPDLVEYMRERVERFAVGDTSVLDYETNESPEDRAERRALEHSFLTLLAAELYPEAVQS